MLLRSGCQNPDLLSLLSESSQTTLPAPSPASPPFPPCAGCFRAKVRDCPWVWASPGLLRHTARGGAAPQRAPAGLCLEARARCPDLLPVGQVPRKRAVPGVLGNASQWHTSFAVLQPSYSAPYCTRDRDAERGWGAQVSPQNFLLTSLHLSLFCSLRDGLPWRPASPEGIRAYSEHPTQRNRLSTGWAPQVTEGHPLR